MTGGNKMSAKIIWTKYSQIETFNILNVLQVGRIH